MIGINTVTSPQEYSLLVFSYVINLSMVQKLINQKKTPITSMTIATPP